MVYCRLAYILITVLVFVAFYSMLVIIFIITAFSVVGCQEGPPVQHVQIPVQQSRQVFLEMFGHCWLTRLILENGC